MADLSTQIKKNTLTLAFSKYTLLAEVSAVAGSAVTTERVWLVHASTKRARARRAFIASSCQNKIQYCIFPRNDSLKVVEKKSLVVTHFLIDISQRIARQWQDCRTYDAIAVWR